MRILEIEYNINAKVFVTSNVVRWLVDNHCEPLALRPGQPLLHFLVLFGLVGRGLFVDLLPKNRNTKHFK